MPTWLKRRLADVAQRKGKSLSDFIRDILSDAVKNEPDAPSAPIPKKPAARAKKKENGR